MKKRKYSELKRNPLVRCIRWMRKLLISIFKLERRTVRSVHSNHSSSGYEPQTGLIGLENFRQGRLITVGELFEQVQWQLPEATDRGTVSVATKSSNRPHDVSWN